MIISVILFALLGWLVGIAINHAADILPKRQTVFQKPKCLNCSTPRAYPAWSALITILTGQKKCPSCGQPQGYLVRAIIIELATPAFFVFLLQRYGYTLNLVIITLYTAILILVTVTDLEHRLIFNVVMLPALIFALAAAFFTPGLAWPTALVGGATGFILSYVAALLARGGLGSGDVILSAFLGLILGFPHIILSLIFGVFLGGFVALILLMTRRVGLKSFIPYGPFLTITGWMMLVWGEEIWRYYFW
ncbi:MAG: prepilin peptidase [Anaerolineae bacterium]|nr:prepilin peptidase [Anaerolineae bacterium]